MSDFCIGCFARLCGHRAARSEELLLNFGLEKKERLLYETPPIRQRSHSPLREPVNAKRTLMLTPLHSEY